MSLGSRQQWPLHARASQGSIEGSADLMAKQEIIQYGSDDYRS
jgi:hypothetical protein